MPGRVPTGSPPLFSSDHGPGPDSVLPDCIAHQGCCRGLAVAAFWLSSAVPHLAGRTDVLLSFDHDVTGIGSPGL